MQTNQANSLQAILFDWAGTVVDYGSQAPTKVVVEIFRRQGVEITVAEAREPMGRAKRDHLATVLRMPRVAAAWKVAHGRPPTESDIDRLYAEFLPLQKSVLGQHCDVIPGVPEVVAVCRERGWKIGSTTGYTRELMDVVCPLARQNGFEPSTVITSDDVPAGRPAPWMIFRAMEQLGVFPPANVAIVDDTTVGIEAGRNAGAWTIAVTKTGNSLGLTAAEVAALPADELPRRLDPIRAAFANAHAHYTIDSVADLLPVLEQIQDRLHRGKSPC